MLGVACLKLVSRHCVLQLYFVLKSSDERLAEARQAQQVPPLRMRQGRERGLVSADGCR